MGRKCIIKSCKSDKDLHSFPRDPKSFREWTDRMQLNLSFEHRHKFNICDLHFDEEMKFEKFRKRTNLITGAYPTLHLDVDVQKVNDSEFSNNKELCEIHIERDGKTQQVELFFDPPVSTEIRLDDSVESSDVSPKRQKSSQFEEKPTCGFGKCFRTYSRSFVKDSAEEEFTFIVESEEQLSNGSSNENENSSALNKCVSQWDEFKTQLEPSCSNCLKEEYQLKLRLLKEKHDEEINLMRQKAALEMRLMEEESKARIAFYQRNSTKSLQPSGGVSDALDSDEWQRMFKKSTL